MNEEIWKDVVGYEGYYQVSNLGRVRSVDRWITNSRGARRVQKGRYVNLQKHYQGYRVVMLWKGCKYKVFRVHRIVADSFIPNPQNLPEINHKDENKTNNCVNNLEWCDRKYNVNYGTLKERGKAKRCKKVICKETGQIFLSSGDAAKWLQSEVSKSIACLRRSIYDSITNRRKSYGYHFEYVKVDKN